MIINSLQSLKYSHNLPYSNSLKAGQHAGLNAPAFGNRRSPAEKNITAEDKRAMLSAYESGASLEDLSKKYKIRLSFAADCIDEARMVYEYLNTNTTMDRIAEQHFVTKQEVHKTLKEWGYSKGDQAFNLGMHKLIADAPELGMSTEELEKMRRNILAR